MSSVVLLVWTATRQLILVAAFEITFLIAPAFAMFDANTPDDPRRRPGLGPGPHARRRHRGGDKWHDWCSC